MVVNGAVHNGQGVIHLPSPLSANCRIIAAVSAGQLLHEVGLYRQHTSCCSSVLQHRQSTSCFSSVLQLHGYATEAYAVMLTVQIGMLARYAELRGYAYFAT